MQIIKPIYGKHYNPGYFGFSRDAKGHEGILNNGIIWFDTLREACEFAAKHVFVVVDENTGIEAAEKGVKYFDLKARIANESIDMVFREPLDLKPETIVEALAYGKKLVAQRRPYDYTGLVVGHPIAKLLNLTKWIKPLRKMPVLFHMPWSFVCSNLAAVLYKSTKQYRNIALFVMWHITRITPVILYNNFPMKKLKLQEKIS